MNNKLLMAILATTGLCLSISSCNDDSSISDSESNISESIEDDSLSEISSDSFSESILESSEPIEEEIKSLKVLSIGNSFALDTNEYLPNVAKSMGIEDIKIATLYIGGCSINRHLENATNNLSLYDYYINEGNGWSSTHNHSIYEALVSEQWDYISIQHGTGDGSRYSEIESYFGLEELIYYIIDNSVGNPKIAFNMTWVGEKGSHEELIYKFNNDTIAYYNAICDLTKNTLTRLENLDVISPTGTAIQNARTAEVGLLTRDNYHLSLNTGRYIAALTFFMALTNLNIKDIPWAPSGMTEYMIDVAIESSINAIITPYSITNSKIQAPEFSWPTDVTYGQAATSENPYYPHAAKEQPDVDEKINLLQYFDLSTFYPIVTSTLQTSNNLNLTIDLNKTPYLYYSFIVPENSDFTFSIYSDTKYSPWLMFLDATKGNAKLGQGAENWDASFANGRKQYTKQTQTGCIDLREYAYGNKDKWVISMMKLYTPKKDGVTMSYFFIGSN